VLWRVATMVSVSFEKRSQVRDKGVTEMIGGYSPSPARETVTTVSSKSLHWIVSVAGIGTSAPGENVTETS